MSTEARNQHDAGASGQRRQAVVLVNDLAPHANALDWVAACSHGLGPGVEVRLVRVTGFEAVRQAAAAAAQAGVWLVISVGGDGTAMAVINGIGSHPTRICVLPGGTSNQLVYNLGQSFKIADNVNALSQFQPIAIDAMRINGIRFASLALTGWMGDALIAYNRLRAKGAFWRSITRPFGPLPYFMIAFWLLRNPGALGGPMKFAYVDAQDNAKKTLEMDVHLFSLSGPPTINEGQTKLNSASDMADGKLEVILIPRSTRMGLFRALGAMSKGDHGSIPGFQTFQTDRVEITLGRKMDLCIDGEEIPYSDHCVVDFDPAPILMLAPRGRKPGSRKLSNPL